MYREWATEIKVTAMCTEWATEINSHSYDVQRVGH